MLMDFGSNPNTSTIYLQGYDMNKAEIIAILRAAPSREIKFPVDLKPVKTPAENWLWHHHLDYNVLKNGIIEVNGDIDLHANGGFPVDFSMCLVKGHFYCVRNKLTSLKGCPKFVKGSFFCCFNDLENLKHIPKGCGRYYTDFGHFDHYSDIPKELL